jgi:uncharacterized protein YndB with AHSA1/START domain
MITKEAVYSDTVVIEAPVETVWQVLTDFDRYGEWNPFCPQMKTRLELGADVEMMVELGNGLQAQVETMERIEENREIAWGMVLGDEKTLRALRTQTLIKISDTRCCYLSVDWFSGELAEAVIDGSGKGIEAGFNACAYGLKKQAESLI